MKPEKTYDKLEQLSKMPMNISILILHLVFL